MSDSTEDKKIKYLVADTTAFLNAVPLNQYAENVLTVPDVIREVKNKRQIRRLCVLPFDLQIREPRAESIKHCVEFAKKTGDYASLSAIDLKVISLAYELEVEHEGSEHLRTEPVVSQVIASHEKPDVMKDNTKLPGWYQPQTGENDNESEHSEEEEEEKIPESSISLETSSEKHLSKEAEDTEEPSDYTTEELEHAFDHLNCTENNDEIILQPETDQDSEDDEETNSVEEDDNNDADDSGWITPSNIKQAKKKLEGKEEDNFIPTVACMSTDFALQNVLKQMNLHISALNGRVIKHLRTYILRCYGCYNTTSIMTKVFCPKCGNKTLKRVAVSLDENGKQVIHINTRRPLTAKYKNQSLPLFKGGKHSRNPILFEDQPIPRQMPSRVAKTKTNALEDDYIAGMSPFVMRDVDSKSAMLRAKGNLKEWARNNNFEEDRRRKHYNRLYK